MEFERDPENPVRVRAKLTPEERAARIARDEEVRARFRPGVTLDELVAMGEITEEDATAIRAEKAAGPPPQPARELVAALRAERQRQGLSLADVADRMGVDRGAIHKIEIGANKNPTVETLSKYAAALGREIRMDLVAAHDGVAGVLSSGVGVPTGLAEATAEEESGRTAER